MADCRFELMTLEMRKVLELDSESDPRLDGDK